MSSLREGPATVVRREDYAAPAYWIDTVDLTFDLEGSRRHFALGVQQMIELSELLANRALDIVDPR